MRIALIIIGLVLAVWGLHWIGQGTGLFVWPSNPVMDNHIEWAYAGAAGIAAGLGLIWYARRR